MKILIVSQYFWPEQFFINDFVHELISQGHVVEVLTGKPNYPDGNVFINYQEKFCVKEILEDGLVIHRVPLRSRRNGGAKSLALNYLSFLVNGLLYGPSLVKARDFDIVLAIGLSPITSVIPAIYLKWILKRPLSIWIQDLWPESLSATGFVKNKFMLASIGVIVRYIYSAASQLIIQSEDFREPVSKFGSNKKIIFCPNSIRDPQSAPLPPCNLTSDLISILDNNFCVVFAGNLGKVQSIDTILSAAKKIQGLDRCKIVLVGTGSQLAWISKRLQRDELSNVVLAGRYPSEQMPHIFNRAGALLVTLSKNVILSHTIPSKLQSYLAGGRPIIGALDGAGAKIIAMSASGLVGAAEDVDVLAENITNMYSMDPIKREKFGASGREFYLRNFELALQTKRLADILFKNLDFKKGEV